MPYIRHRPRMVRQSVYEDLRGLLTELNWMPGEDGEVLGILGTPITLTDYFPVNAVYQGEEVEMNTLALDQGTPGEPEYADLGSETREQEYTFNLAFFSESDAVALSLFSDLTDRYKGGFRGITNDEGDPLVSDQYSHESVVLFNYLDETPTPVLDMDVASFDVVKSPEQPAPTRMLWFAQLVIVDLLEPDEDTDD